MDTRTPPALEHRTPASLYRIVFQQRDEECELYAVRVAQGHLPAFLEVEQILFADRATGPGANAVQERLRDALATVKRCYLPLAHIVRIDEIAYATLAELRGEGPRRIASYTGRGRARQGRAAAHRYAAVEIAFATGHTESNLRPAQAAVVRAVN